MCIRDRCRDCNPGIPDRFSIPKPRDYEIPNAGISGLENNVLTFITCEMHALITKTNAQSVTTKQHHTPKNSLSEHIWHFATALIVPYYQKFLIVHRVWHWQPTRHAQNIKKTCDWLFDCLYRSSKLVEIQLINRISNNYSRTNTPWVLPPTYSILLTHVMCRFRSQTRRHW